MDRLLLFATTSITKLAIRLGLVCCLIVSGLLTAEAQIVIENGDFFNDPGGNIGTLPSGGDVSLCGLATAEPPGVPELVFTVAHTGPADVVDPMVSITFPTGVNYVEGSLSIIDNGDGYTISSISATTNMVTFMIDGTLSTGDRAQITLLRIANCEALVGGGQVDEVTVATVTEPSLSYEVVEAVLTVVADMPVNTFVGATENVLGTISNGGFGVVDSFLLKITDAPGDTTLSVTVGTTSLNKVDEMGKMSFWLIDSTILDDENLGDGDGVFENAESFMFSREVLITSCELAGDSYNVLFGCDGEVCQVSDPSAQQFNLPLAIPEVRYTGGTVVQATNLCDTIILEHTFTNNGTGTAFNLRYLAGFGASGLVLSGSTGGGRNFPVVAVCIDGNPVKFAPNSTSSEAGLVIYLDSLEADPDGVNGLSDQDMDGFFDDLPIDSSVTVTIKHEVLPETGCPADRSSGSYKVATTYTDQCMEDIPRIIQGALGSLSDFTGDGPGSVVGPSDINDEDIFTLEICGNQRFGGTLVSCPTDTLTLQAVVPGGFSLVSASADRGTTVGIPNNAFQVDDTVFVNVDFVSSSTFCFYVELELDCDFYDNSPFNLEFVYTCDEDAECDATERFSCPAYAPIVHCPQPCPQGGLTTEATEAIRSTLGFANPFTCTEFANPATLSAVQLKRAMPCDTVCIIAKSEQKGGASGGMDMEWTNAFFHFEYDPEATNGANTLTQTGGTVTLYDIETMTAFTCDLPLGTNTTTNNAGADDLHELEIDMTACLAMMPDGVLTPGDSMNVNLKVVVEKTSALDNDVPTQLEEIIMYHYNLVDTIPIVDTVGQNETPGVLDIVRCDRYGLELYLHEPENGGGGGLTNREVDGCEMFNGAKTFPWSGSEDWYPGEIRPNYKLDSVVIAFSSCDSLLFETVELRSEGNASDGYGAQTHISTFLGTPDRIVLSPTSKRYIWYNDDPQNIWPLGDMNGRFNREGGYTIIADYASSCLSKDGRLQMGFYAQRYGYAHDASCYEPRNNIGDVLVNHELPSTAISDQTGIIEATKDTVCWTIQLQNVPPVEGGYFFVGFEETSSAGIDVVQLEEIGPDTLIPLLPYAEGDWAVVNPNFPPSSSVDYKVTAVINACELDSIKVVSGFECIAPPVDPTAYACDFDSTYLKVQPLQSQVQLIINQQPGPYDFCTIIEDTLTIQSSQRAFLYDARVGVSLPSGLTEDDLMVQVLYPNNASGTVESIAPTFSPMGDTLYVDASQHSAIQAMGGIPGIDDANPGMFPMGEDRQVSVIVQWITDCDFLIGSPYRVIAYGNRPCGDPAIDNGVSALSDPILINGVMQPFAAILTPALSIDTIRGCESEMVMFNTTVQFGSTTDQDSVRITLPPGTTYVDGTYNCTAADMSTCPVFVRVDMLPSGEEQVVLSVPGGIVGDPPVSIPFEIGFMAEPGGLCNEGGEILIQVTSTVPPIFCPSIGEDCVGLQLEVGNARDTIFFQKSVASFTSVDYLCVDEEDFLYDGFVRIDSLELEMDDSIQIQVLCASDPTILLDMATVYGPVSAGDSAAFNGIIINMPCPDGGLIFSISNEENCVCTSVQDTVMRDCVSPSIVLEKSAISTVPASSGEAGHFDVTYEMVAVNDGPLKLRCIQVLDDLSSQLQGFEGVVSGPTLLAPPATMADMVPTVNMSYNGAVFDSLFIGTDG
nr:hypothetical protein [Saprospiraceae bacterium]